MRSPGDLHRVDRRVSRAPIPEKIPDTFLRVPKTTRGGERETEPVVTLRCAAAYGHGGVRINLSRQVLDLLGFKSSGPKMHVQVFTSASTLKLSRCSREAEDDRMIAGDGYITARELADWFRMEPGMMFRCKAEVVSGKEVWATYPTELRDRIDAINGVVR